MNNFRVALLQEIRLIIQCMQNRKKKTVCLGNGKPLLKTQYFGGRGPGTICPR